MPFSIPEKTHKLHQPIKHQEKKYIYQVFAKSEVNQNILSCLKYNTKAVIGGGRGSLFLCVSSVKRKQKNTSLNTSFGGGVERLRGAHLWGQVTTVGALRSTFSQRCREAEWVELLEAQGLFFLKSATQSQVRQGGEDVWLGSNNL